MRLNSSSIVCLSAHSSADTYLHGPIFFVCGFGRGNWGFFVVFFFVDVDAWGKHGGAAVAIGHGVFTSPTLDVVVFVITTFEEDSGVGVWSVASRLANSAHFFSCRTYALKRKSSAHASATVFQNGGSACVIVVMVGRGAIQKVGF
jgi:hypothetical protein